MNARSTTVAILAGGRGTRMGVTKDRLQINGVYILEHLRRRLRECDATSDWPTLLVTSPEQPSPQGADGFDQIAMDDAPALGPLAGTIAALKAISTETVCVLAMDAPCIEPTYVRWLADELAVRHEVLGLCGRQHSSDHGAGQIEPLPGAFRRTSLALLEAELANNRRSLHGLQRNPLFLSLDIAARWPADQWRNLNTPEDLLSIHATLA